MHGIVKKINEAIDESCSIISLPALCTDVFGMVVIISFLGWMISMLLGGIWWWLTVFWLWTLLCCCSVLTVEENSCFFLLCRSAAKIITIKVAKKTVNVEWKSEWMLIEKILLNFVEILNKL